MEDDHLKTSVLEPCGKIHSLNAPRLLGRDLAHCVVEAREDANEERGGVRLD